MPTLILTIFLIQLSIHLINTIGASTINELLWILYTRLPISSQSLHKQSSLRAEVVHLKREMAATSAQDNFAKWAKLRREHDKVLQRHDEIAATNSSTRSKFNAYASATRWISTNGLRLFLQFWHARTPVFGLPAGGWVPGGVEWLVGLPRAKGLKGGVSVQVWGWVCVVMIGLLGEVVGWGVEWVVRSRSSTRTKEKGKGEGEGMKMRIPVGDSFRAGDGKGREGKKTR